MMANAAKPVVNEFNTAIRDIGSHEQQHQADMALELWVKWSLQASENLAQCIITKRFRISLSKLC